MPAYNVPAYYDDGTGLCFWCPAKATADWCGVPLCDQHAEQELQKDGVYQ